MSFFALILLTATPSSTNFDGRWQIESLNLSALPDGAGTEVAASEPFNHRFRVGIHHKQGKLNAELSLRLFTFDRIAAFDRSATHHRAIELRRAKVSFVTGFGQFIAGIYEPSWGLGLVAGGRAAQRETMPYSFAMQPGSDVAAGVAYGLRKGRLIASLAAAQVLRDENADFSLGLDGAEPFSGDRGRQLVAALRYRVNSARELGVYGAYRMQTDARGDILNAAVVDLYGRWDYAIGLSDRLRLGFEGAMINGETDRLTSEGAHSIGANDLQVASFGALALIGATLADGRLNAALEAGYASADVNPEDNKLTRFTMDHNHRVGVLIIPQLWRHITERTVINTSDPGRSGAPPKGIDRYASRGAVTGLAYLNPRVSFRLKPKGKLALHGAYVLAALPDGAADPYQSFRQGGATNPFVGSADAHLLGQEVDLGVSVTTNLRKQYALWLSLEGAVGLPGAATADLAGDRAPLYALRVFVELRGRETSR
jgi:hypothetical protein